MLVYPPKRGLLANPIIMLKTQGNILFHLLDLLENVSIIKKRRDMGKVVEKIKLINVFEPEKEIELEAIIDTGATMLVLPQNVIDRLNLRKMREVKVRYANNKTEIKSIYGIVTVEICGRAGEFNVLAEPEGAQPLVGQIILEQLDLIVDPSTRKVIPNPRSPEMPMVEILMATSPNQKL